MLLWNQQPENPAILMFNLTIQHGRTRIIDMVTQDKEPTLPSFPPPPCSTVVRLSLSSQVHDSGFGVQEEGVPSAQRVLLADCPGEAVLALLRYLYTGRCPAPPASLLPPLLELATRSVPPAKPKLGG